MSEKIGLALGGGGSRGSYQIGIIKALKEENILKDIHYISGASSGTLNTMMILDNMHYNEMIETWQSVKNDDIYSKESRSIKLKKFNLYDLEHLREKIIKTIPLKGVKDNKVQGYAGVCKVKKDSFFRLMMLHKMKKEFININNTKDPYQVAIASSSVPFVFKAKKIDNSYYVDGGAIDNCPLKPLTDAGCKIIFVVPVDWRFRAKKHKKSDILLVNIKTRQLFRIMLYDMFNFNPDKVKKYAEYGYQTGKLIIKKLRDMNYLDNNNVWQRPKGHKHVIITKKEERRLRIGE